MRITIEKAGGSDGHTERDALRKNPDRQDHLAHLSPEERLARYERAQEKILAMKGGTATMDASLDEVAAALGVDIAKLREELGPRRAKDDAVIARAEENAAALNPDNQPGQEIGIAATEQPSAEEVVQKSAHGGSAAASVETAADGMTAERPGTEESQPETATAIPDPDTVAEVAPSTSVHETPKLADFAPEEASPDSVTTPDSNPDTAKNNGPSTPENQPIPDATAEKVPFLVAFDKKNGELLLSEEEVGDTDIYRTLAAVADRNTGRAADDGTNPYDALVRDYPDKARAYAARYSGIAAAVARAENMGQHGAMDTAAERETLVDTTIAAEVPLASGVAMETARNATETPIAPEIRERRDNVIDMLTTFQDRTAEMAASLDDLREYAAGNPALSAFLEQNNALTDRLLSDAATTAERLPAFLASIDGADQLTWSGSDELADFIATMEEVETIVEHRMRAMEDDIQKLHKALNTEMLAASTTEDRLRDVEALAATSQKTKAFTDATDKLHDSWRSRYSAIHQTLTDHLTTIRREETAYAENPTA